MAGDRFHERFRGQYGRQLCAVGAGLSVGYGQFERRRRLLDLAPRGEEHAANTPRVGQPERVLEDF